MHRASAMDSLFPNSIGNRFPTQEVSMSGIAFSTGSQSSPPHRPATLRGDHMVLVSMRAKDALSFLASMRALLPEGAVVLGPAGAMSEGVETGRDRHRPMLTERQRDVLCLLAEGLSNKEIARRLALSHFTVRNHVSQILRSFNFLTRHEAEAWGRISGRTGVTTGERLLPDGAGVPERSAA